MAHKLNDTSEVEERLAGYTDQIRAGEKPVTPVGLADLAPVVRGLDRLMPRPPLDDVARARIALPVMDEWDTRHKTSRRRWRPTQASRLLVAGVGWALLVLLLLAANGAQAAGVFHGTALGGTVGVFALVVALPVTLAGLVWWFRHLR
ncbi:MAG TPA: hypothetical protein PKD09_21300 [Aggregatilinea sp.]|jgi:hypothetical protein|uniref:hypothetical protein n=1 Tax=Aggregatilinea sp. TaxID=2806333 RepID=UPI002BB5826F|nr:hypothetical protein [Aggregatilinea sp.]HML24205.1 hypothetical protein [Aggregatilinea sp.]